MNYEKIELTSEVITMNMDSSTVYARGVTDSTGVESGLPVFKDGETVLSEQTIEYGKDAVVPIEPTRPEEEWGRWKFVAWNGNYTNITKEEIITAEFEKVFCIVQTTFSYSKYIEIEEKLEEKYTNIQERYEL